MNPLITGKKIAKVMILAASPLLFWACGRIQVTVPPLEEIFGDETDVAFWVEFEELPINWEQAAKQLEEHQNQIEDFVGQEAFEVIQKMNLEADKIVRIASSVTLDIKLNENGELENPESLGWVMGIDIRFPLTANLLLNQLQKGSEDLTFKIIESQEKFELISVSKEDAGEIFIIAVAGSVKSQVRVGSRQALLNTMIPQETPKWFRSESILPDHQTWYYFKMPSEVTEYISNLERKIPIDPGVLLSGFEGAFITQSLTSEQFDTRLALEFSDASGSDNAYSYLRLGMNFVIKPFIRSQAKGISSDFLRSLKLHRIEDRVFLDFSVTEKDLVALAKLDKDGQYSDLIESFFDLIQES